MSWLRDGLVRQYVSVCWPVEKVVVLAVTSTPSSSTGEAQKLFLPVAENDDEQMLSIRKGLSLLWGRW